MEAVGADLRIRPMVPGDREGILDLLRLSLGEGEIPRSTEYWTWKHESNPFGSSPGLVAEVDNEIVGLRVFMRWTWQAGGREIQAVRAVDTATHPEWRGRRIFTRLTLGLVERLEVDPNVAFVFNTPNDRSRPGYLKMGWQSVGRVSLWIRPQRPWRMLRSLANGMFAQRKTRIPPGAAGNHPSVAQFLDRANPELLLSRRDGGEGKLSTWRTPAYLRWRYTNIPYFDYRAVWSEEEGGVAIIFRIRPRGDLLELRLCEILIGSGKPVTRSAASLIRELARSLPVDYVVAMGAPGAPERRTLRSAGFLPAPRIGPILTVRPLSNRSEPDPANRSSWRLSIGDLELF